MSFFSDNWAPVAPPILAAVAAANQGAAPPYGDDAATEALARAFGAVFETAVAVLPCASGTAANGLALAAILRAGGRVFCHEDAHIRRAEEGAPAVFVPGAVCVGLPGEKGKIAPATLERALAGAHTANAALSLTQLSEMGTVYRPDEIAALADLAHQRGLAVHLDGARFANAVAALGCAPAEMAWRAGVDVLSFGASKNGALNAEAVVAFTEAADLSRARMFPVRKRTGHVYSKMRFLSTQLLAALEDGLWLDLAGRANAAAARLAAGLAALPGIALAAPVEGNMVFVEAAPDMLPGLAEAGHAVADAAGRRPIRLVTSWATSDDEIDRLLAAIRRVG